MISCYISRTQISDVTSEAIGVNQSDLSCSVVVYTPVQEMFAIGYSLHGPTIVKDHT